MLRLLPSQAPISATLLLVVGLASPLLATDQSRVIYVDKTATGIRNGTSWQDAYQELWVALPTAATGDQIWVAAGTYAPSNPPARRRDVSFQVLHAIEIYGGFAGGEVSLNQRNPIRNRVVLSGDIGTPSYRPDNTLNIVTVNHTDPDVVHIEGVVIQDAHQYNSGLQGGAGLLLKQGGLSLRECAFVHNETGFSGGALLLKATEAVTIERCEFFENRGDSGGAIVVWGHIQADLKILDCSFIRNLARDNGAGGAIYLGYNSTCTVKNSKFWGNRSLGVTYVTNGGAIYSSAATLLVTGCEFESNSAWYGGGALYSGEGSTRVVNTTFRSNVAAFGGAVYARSSNAQQIELERCGFVKNRASNAGGAIAAGGSRTSSGANQSISRSHFVENESKWSGGAIDGLLGTVDNSVFIANRVLRGNGGAIAVSKFDALLLVASTVVGNQALHGLGGGIVASNRAEVRMLNTILWSNLSADVTLENQQVSGDPDVYWNTAYSDIQGLRAGVGWHNVNIDPDFVDLANRDLRLGPASPLIDRGHPDFLRWMPYMTRDYAGDPRVQGGGSDIGADEAE